MHTKAAEKENRKNRTAFLSYIGLLAFLAWGMALTSPAIQTPASDPQQIHETIVIDAAAQGRPFPHFWEKTFGSGRAVLSLRDSYWKDVQRVKGITDLQYIRCHAIFHDEIGIYDEDASGNPVYNFTYVDQIYDLFLKNAVRPFVELSFMPRKLASASTEHSFWYKPIVAPPKDWSRWENLVFHFAQHLVDRYGIEEVSRWYFEVWNEPNIDFWAGEPKETTYYELYDRAARGLKRVSARLRVGGPATAQAAWVDRFIEHCTKNNVPVDFVSTHAYANDSSMNLFGTEENISRKDMLARAVRKVYDQVRLSSQPDLPIHWSEFNASYMNEVDVTDSPFMGPWLANTIRQSDGLVDEMSYWTFSDVFEEQGVAKRPFYGGFGLIAQGGIPKASFNVFQLLHKLGSVRLANVSDSVIVTRRPDDSLAIAVWNYSPPGVEGEAKRIMLTFKNLRHRRHLRIQFVDRNHGSSLTAWEGMGRPPFPSQEQQQALRRAAALPAAEERSLSVRNGEGSTEVVLPSHCLILVEAIK